MILNKLTAGGARLMLTRAPDLIIGEPDNPYMERWYVIPRNKWFNIYLHHIQRSDDDRALHDHPWVNLSILLLGSYIEHTIDAGGIERRVLRVAGTFKFRLPGAAHRLEIADRTGCLTLFITGPRMREWGFHCPKAGGRHWKDFTQGENGETIGMGCGEPDEAPAPVRSHPAAGVQVRRDSIAGLTTEPQT